MKEIKQFMLIKNHCIGKSIQGILIRVRMLRFKI